jgi:hypothetical protein
MSDEEEHEFRNKGKYKEVDAVEQELAARRSLEESEYWKTREANIARNKSLMADLDKEYGNLFRDLRKGKGTLPKADGAASGSSGLVCGNYESIVIY